MNQNPEARKRYTHGGDHLRQGMAAYFFGLLQCLEMAWRNPELVRAITTKKPAYLVGGFVQEHQLATVPDWAFPHQFHHAFLAVPDVKPKESAVRIARRAKLPLYVWTKEAKEALRHRYVSSTLVAPFMLVPFLSPTFTFGKVEERRALVKTSGSGIVPSELAFLVQNLEKMRYAYEIHLPTGVITNDGIFSVPPSVEERIDAYIKSLCMHPPELLITCSSEQTQVSTEARLAGWTGTHMTFPPRGKHEENNVLWGKKHGVIQEETEFIYHLPRDIRRASAVKKGQVSELRQEVGTLSVRKACEKALDRVQ